MKKINKDNFPDLIKDLISVKSIPAEKELFSIGMEKVHSDFFQNQRGDDVNLTVYSYKGKLLITTIVEVETASEGTLTYYSAWCDKSLTELFE